MTSFVNIIKIGGKMFLLSTIITDDKEKLSKLESVYTLYKKRMWYVANQILNNAQDAEDAVHNALIGIARNLDHITDIDSKATLAYVITAAKHAAINISTREHHNNTVSLDSFINSPDMKTVEAFSELEQKTIVLSILRQLPDTYRNVLYLHYYHELSEKEIAVFLNKNYSTVRKQVSRAKKLFADIMSKEDC